MKKKGTLEKFEAKHKDVKVEIYDLPDGETECSECGGWGPPGDECDGCKPARKYPRKKFTAEEEAADELASKYDVEAIPCFVFVDDKGYALAQSDEIRTMAEIEKLYTKAQKAAGA